MDSLRLATLEEIQPLLTTSDLTSNSRVVTYGGKDFAVLRPCWEVDPMRFHPSSNPRRRLEVIGHIETLLRFQGEQQYYFNVPITDEKYIAALDGWGAIKTSPTPEFRFKKVL